MNEKVIFNCNQETMDMKKPKVISEKVFNLENNEVAILTSHTLYIYTAKK